jgi:DNA polymerase elongation subunit (family B)
MLYETDPNKGKLKFMGLSLKRRDSCDYLKDVYGGILKILMDTKRTNSIQASIEYLNQCLNELVESKVPMDKLMITKALRSYYKNPATIAHRVLADRIAKRDPGNKPKPGDRMKFVHFVCEASSSGKKPLQGEKIETPEFIVQNNLQIDYNHYITNQLMKPLQQLFGLALVQIWELQNKKAAIKTYYKDINQLQDEFPDMETFMKKKEKYCSAKIKSLLFDKTLDKIYNTKHGIQTITSFFR